ncbi:E3 ubiquitin-protein ligase UHRF1-like [Lycorma delicatula]|uniref:E3 ubiquitin-protein ligase UHRF1-like n=1 Tax=Lycorma delicatula TaxID=130591 RepID=UPI003F514B45
MYIQVRTVDGKKKVTVLISKTAKIEELKLKIEEELEIAVDKQRLFFRGKQLENDHTLFDYAINLNDVVQLMVKQDVNNTDKESSAKDYKENDASTVFDKENKEPSNEIGDKVDCKGTCGAWFEGEIKEVLKSGSAIDDEEKENKAKSHYKVTFLNAEECDSILEFKDVRPRARNLIPLHDLKKGQLILANYNGDSPDEPGFWYTCKVTKISNSRRPRLFVTVELGRNEITSLENCEIKFINKIFKLEDPKLITERTSADESFINGAEAPERNLKTYFCNHCKDAPVEKCNHCGCQKCQLKKDPNLTILCDECDDAYHIYCLNPPLEEVPKDDDWYCPSCKNDENEIVKAGEKLKFSKKKSKMASSITSNGKTRDWGKGMACVGRTKECTIVPPNHFGPIPGVEVGTTWKFRVQASEAGVHRPHVAGIHGRENEGAYSIVLSGGYEDDVDNGESFLFTGSGGRDLSGNKRTAEQSCDQTLTRYNLALALNCNAPLNTEEGANAKDWKKGKPVRVVRNFKLQKHSKYAPEEGNRYDGIYKVVKYYPEKGKSGFLVWRYMLRRDDPTPAPWTPEGKKWIESQGLNNILIPVGYNEAEKAKKAGKKRVLSESHDLSENESPPKKKAKAVAAYKLPDKLKKMISKDTKNKKLWETITATSEKGKQEFLAEVQNNFLCICCLELLNKPITTECKHNVCKACMVRSFKSEVYTCAHCRHDFCSDYQMVINKELQEILDELFPGYNRGR